ARMARYDDEGPRRGGLPRRLGRAADGAARSDRVQEEHVARAGARDRLLHVGAAADRRRLLHEPRRHARRLSRQLAATDVYGAAGGGRLRAKTQRAVKRRRASFSLRLPPASPAPRSRRPSISSAHRTPPAPGRAWAISTSDAA